MELADDFQENLLLDHSWKSSEKDNRFICIFPSGASLEKIICVPGTLTGKHFGWTFRESGDYRYILLGSVPVGIQPLTSVSSITDVGILCGRS